MKKNLLLAAVLTVSVLASAQAPSPYPYASFKKDVVTPTYSVPDAAIASPAALAANVSVINTQSLGLQCINFDQVSASTASSYAGDYLKTCGPTPSAFAETANVTAIRSWTTDDANFSAGTTYSSKNEPWIGFNSSPSTFRYSGGWYYYTVNFTEATEYAFFLRIRSGNMQLSKAVQGASQLVDKIVTVQLYDKSDMTNPLNTWTLNYAGIVVGSVATLAPISTNSSVAFHAWAKGAVNATDATIFDPTVGQPASFWSKAATTYTIPAVGEYVIKITDPALKIEGQDAASAAGDANNAVGSFTFIIKSATGLNNATQINANATVFGKTISVSSNVKNVEVYNLIGSKIMSKAVENSRFQLNATGVYMLKMITAEGSKIQKIVLR